METTNLSDASREILWNLESPANPILMYLLFFISLGFCGWGLWRRFVLWTDGTEDSERLSKPFKRLFLFFRDILAQHRVNREAFAGTIHSLIFFGFMVLVFATTVVFLEQDLGLRIFHGRFYLAVSLLADIFGFALFVGVCLALYRRSAQRPAQLHSTPGDSLVLLVLALLVVQGFMLEGMRIHATSDPWAAYSPVGYLCSLLFWSLSSQSIGLLHFVMWWFHTITVFVLIALFPYTKFFHIFSSSANVFFSQHSRPKGAMKYPGDIETLLEKAMESEDEDSFGIGVSNVEDLSWKQRLDLDACTACGRCQAECPACRSGKALSPKWLILDSRDHMLKLFAEGKLVQSKNGKAKSIRGTLEDLDRTLLKRLVLPCSDNSKDNAAYLRADNELVQKARKAVGESLNGALAGEVMEEDVFWACTTCRACEEVCPVCIEHIDLISEVRRAMVMMEGKVPGEAQAALRAIETRGNPFGPAEDRANWTEGLEVPVLKEGDEVQVLYWVGCVSAYDKRKQKIAKSMARILASSGRSWGILGDKEHCTGDPARRLGDENIFQAAAKHNIEVLKSVSYDMIVTNCPHCFHTLKNEYPAIEDYAAERKIRIVHHSVLIAELIESGEISVSPKIEEKTTFHDPCYLGRYNDTFEEPREVLRQLSGCNSLEMKDCYEKALCCGAGGGHYWFDMKVGKRINVERVEQADTCGASLIATACPFCMQMLEDAVILKEKDEDLRVRDIAELVAEALEEEN